MQTREHPYILTSVILGGLAVLDHRDRDRDCHDFEGRECQRDPLAFIHRMGCIWAAEERETGKELKIKERETGIEPATSSLGNWASIESKDQSRVSASTISIKTAVIFTFHIRVQPNGLQLGCTIMTRN